MRLLLRQYRASYQNRAVLGAAGSLAVGQAISAGKLILGLAVQSPWFLVTAAYYELACIAKAHVLYRNHRISFESDDSKRLCRQVQVYRHSGFFLCALGLSYFLVCRHMYHTADTGTYSSSVVYGVAAVGFYKIIMAVRGMAVTRRMHDPVVSALKTISLLDACVSIVAVQRALLVMQASPAANTSSALLGMCLSGLFACLGLWMLAHNKKWQAILPDNAVRRLSPGEHPAELTD